MRAAWTVAASQVETTGMHPARPAPVLPAPPPMAAPAPMAHAEPALPERDAEPRRAVESLVRLLGLAGAALGWRRVAPGNALQHEARARLLARLRERPGEHLRGLARGLGLTVQNTNYHLRQLEQVGLVSSMRVGRRRCFYAVDGGRASREQALAAGVLASGHRDRILAVVEAAPGIHQSALARHLGLAHGSVSWALRQLVDEGFLDRAAEGNRQCYTITSRGRDALQTAPAMQPATRVAAPPLA
jgi:predicted transcriptional regulator